MLKIKDGIHVEELRQFRGLVLTSPDGQHIMMQTTEFGAVKAMPVSFNREEIMKVYNWLTEVLWEVQEYAG